MCRDLPAWNLGHKIDGIAEPSVPQEQAHFIDGEHAEGPTIGGVPKRLKERHVSELLGSYDEPDRSGIPVSVLRTSDGS
jgi:hypothetical protein